MPENRQRYVVLCQQLLAAATVLAVAAPAAGITTLEIVAPVPREETAVGQGDAEQVAAGDAVAQPRGAAARPPWSSWR
jgi:hypothetical protein